MSMNIPPHIPQVIVNSAMPATESLAKANALKEVVPPTVKPEAIVPQKSREQDVRPPINQPSNSTYDDIQTKQKDADIIPEDDAQSQDEQTSGQDSGSEQQGSEKDNTDISTASAVDESDKEDRSASDNSDDAQQVIQDQQVKEQEQAEQQQIQQLQQRDNEVRAHEQAHAAIGGSHAGTPNYEYQTGPNGQKYAVGGEVSIDVSKESDPEATIRKMQTVQAAALAPAEPSSQDRKVAAQAARNIAEAKAEMIQQNAEINDAKGSVNSGSSTVQVSSNDLEIENNEVGTHNGSEQHHPDKMALAQETHTAETNISDTRVEQSKTAQVISNRYTNAVIPHEQGFSAVA